MPGVIPPTAGPEFLARALQQFDRRISALELANNSGVVDAKGVIRVKTGLQSDGTYGLWVFDAEGNVECKLGDLGGGVTEGPFGLAVLAPGATPGLPASYQRVGGVGDSFLSTSETYSSTSWGDLATVDGVVPVDIGPSGQAEITIAGFIAPGSNPSAESALMGVSIDGGDPTGNPALTAEEPANSGLGGTYSFTFVEQGMGQGGHTFQLKYRVSTSGVAASYANRSLVVRPL